LLYELDAAGEVTNDLLANLIEALKEAPDSNFQRWLSNQVDLWSMRKLDWKQDGSDLMELRHTTRNPSAPTDGEEKPISRRSNMHSNQWSQEKKPKKKRKNPKQVVMKRW
jgi:hypothetical protein